MLTIPDRLARRLRWRQAEQFTPELIWQTRGALLTLTLAGWMREWDQLRDVALDQRLDLVVDLVEAGHFNSGDRIAELRDELFLDVEAPLLNSDHLFEFLSCVRIAEVLVLVRKILEFLNVA